MPFSGMKSPISLVPPFTPTDLDVVMLDCMDLSMVMANFGKSILRSGFKAGKHPQRIPTWSSRVLKYAAGT
jgi:hypothetical protein